MDTGGTKAPREEVQQHLLELLADQSRRMPWAVGGLLVFLAVMAAQRLPAWIPALWFAIALAVLLVRRHWLGLLPLQAEVPVERRMRIAIGLSLLNGCVHGISLAAFPWLQETERAFFSLLLLGLATGAVGTTAGHRRIYLSYMLAAAGALPLVWAFTPGAGLADISFSVLIVPYLLVLVGLADHAWRDFNESVHMRYKDRALAAQLAQALAQATAANQAKTRFLAAASHDLRQPLHTIGLLVAALSLRPMEGRDREVVDLLSQVTVALSEQLDQLLDISKLDAGVVQPDKKMVDLGELLKMHHAEMRGAIEEKGLRPVLDTPLGVHCWTDPTLLLRILRNLTENAIKFTPSGRVELRMRVADGVATIEVEDTGRGIPQSEREMVFEEFYQVDNPERDRTKGLGLGLSIVRRLCGLLGMEATLRSAEGRGTCISLRLPLGALGTIVPAQAQPVRRHSFAGLCVLLIDDERSVRMGMRVLLEELGCRCLDASSREEAVQLARSRKPDVILADLRLRQGQSGISAIADVVRAVGPTPALLISGDTAPDRLQEAARASIKLLHKPVGLPALQAELERVLDARMAL